MVLAVGTLDNRSWAVVDRKGRGSTFAAQENKAGMGHMVHKGKDRRGTLVEDNSSRASSSFGLC